MFLTKIIYVIYRTFFEVSMLKLVYTKVVVNEKIVFKKIEICLT